MRLIKAADITRAVASLFKQANYNLGDDVLAALNKARKAEESPAGREALDAILENARIAADEKIPLCQDCGAAVVFLEIGQDVLVVKGDLYKAVNEGVKQAYKEGYLRKSMVDRPFSDRKNTGDNTPAVIHTDIVPGNKLKITVLPKGGGAENMAKLGMLLPAAGRKGVIDFVVNAVSEAWSNPCPPVIVGVGVGGTAEKAMFMAKHALIRKIGKPSSNKETAALEKEILHKVNDLGIGPMGYGGRITALAVHVETFPAHITALPVAVNLQCNSARHREVVL
ncbi:MAG: fumarate hydratase [Chloroflexi bacterium RBG_16_50_11]|nr:MAG: fumarate hydratase [Chloroflexi bacterium RBG_16_50_11]